MVTPAFVLLTQSKSVGATTPEPPVVPTSERVALTVAKLAEQAYTVAEAGRLIPVASRYRRMVILYLCELPVELMYSY